ncbi:protein SIEL [Macadamia integrifolia]|uniref:protein SIEL n=1 Tax=Macadamia integrifolia TaxID=60698 RepID=UPI001C4ECB9A|nr:protein SIEL [Macadamia integrifolia]XP_042496074.1 protein SIEL [Macadamia integrifolia]XP_042496075.1 protein SIEL [Macadamia integrifolia]
MGIDGQVWRRCEQQLSLTTVESTNRRDIDLQALASARALIVNPSTSEETISHILETLVQSLQPKCDHFPLLYISKLLSDIALHHQHLSFSITKIIRPYTVVGKNASKLTARALSVIFTIAESDESLLSTILELGEDFALSFCFSPSVSVRLWFLVNVDRFHIHPRFLVTLLGGLMKDPYPSVRRAALCVLASLSKYTDVEGHGLIAECYDGAVELFLDEYECVRSAAVRVVSKLGEILVAPGSDEDSTDWFDIVFIQLCSMVRDMSMEVRNEAFVALGKMKLVSEDLLLQSLSKKVLRVTKEKKIVGRCSTKEYELPVSGAAGAFVHGLEDEFHKVRSSACNSLGMLTVFSGQFANDALTLLMDMLNDDSTVVRLQALETMHLMAKSDNLRVQETHIHMFIDCLMDTSSLIRYQVRKIFQLMKLPVPEMFASLICGLLTNLEKYPQDEDDVYSVLFNTGRSHGNFAVSFLKDVAHEMEPSCEGDFSFDTTRVTALFVLAISVPLSHERHIGTMPPRIFRYAIPLIGRISRILGDEIDQEALFGYLSHCSRSFNFAAKELSFREDEFTVPGVKEGCVATSFEKHQLKRITIHEESTDAVKVILKTIAESWPLIHAGCTGEVLKTLKGCKEELITIAMDSPESIRMLAFMSNYIRVIKLLAKACKHLLLSKKLQFCRMERLNLLLEKLDASLRELRYRFSGSTTKEELHVLELVLFSFAMRLSQVEIFCHQTAFKRMKGTISRVELLCREGSTEPSEFVKEVQKSFSQAGTFNNESSSDPFLLKRSLEFFSLKQVEIHGSLKHIKAEVDVPHNDSEHPLTFISGLPVGVTFQISLYNIDREDRFWLQMAVGEYTQYAFLDLIQFEGCDEVRTTTLTVPFYRTPKMISFVLKACIGRECLFEDVDFVKGQPGPKHELIFLCKVKEVYLLNGG